MPPEIGRTENELEDSEEMAAENAALSELDLEGPRVNGIGESGVGLDHSKSLFLNPILSPSFHDHGTTVNNWFDFERASGQATEAVQQQEITLLPPTPQPAVETSSDTPSSLPDTRIPLPSVTENVVPVRTSRRSAPAVWRIPNFTPAWFATPQLAQNHPRAPAPQPGPESESTTGLVRQDIRFVSL